MGIKAVKPVTDDVNDNLTEAIYTELPLTGNADYEFYGYDWYDTATGELLTNYIPCKN